ncbi:hypothetical protein BVX98_01280 [bacterium F11]|nr:hypothetical protein BVX98_01280 [bacterium F11]
MEDIPILENAINQLYEQGGIVIAPAGNDGDFDNLPEYPASYPNVISVAATDQRDQRAILSSFGDTVDLAAPGVFINSTMPGNLYEERDGTSIASAFVSGAAALLLSQNPDLTNEQIKEALLDGDEIDDTPDIGKRLNVFRALNHIRQWNQTLGDGKIGSLDLEVLKLAWQATPLDGNWNSHANLFYETDKSFENQIINSSDLNVLALAWGSEEMGLNSERWNANADINGIAIGTARDPLIPLAHPGSRPLLNLFPKPQGTHVVYVNAGDDQTVSMKEVSYTLPSLKAYEDGQGINRSRETKTLYLARPALVGDVRGVKVKDEKNFFWFIKTTPDQLDSSLSIHDPFKLKTVLKTNKKGIYEVGLLAWNGDEWNVDYTQLEIGTHAIDIITNPYPIDDSFYDPSAFSQKSLVHQFNPERGERGTIELELGATSNIRIVMYNRTGREVIDLLNTTLPRGTHTIHWDGRDQNGQLVKSGMYLGRIFKGTEVLPFKLNVSK